MVQQIKNKHKHKNKGKNNKKQLPHVSICTPTFNRRPFFYGLIKCIENQTYPKELLEWIIVDDGTDKIEDIIKDIDMVKYFKIDEKMKLGRKRNFMHEKCSGDIIIYFDDDDYYPPERISHAVNMLLTHPKALCGGSSDLNIYFNHNHLIYKFGPYGEKHATAGTFAFRKELLKTQKYNDDASLAEEKYFLNDYTIPFVQFESKKTILVISHKQNTFDKKLLLSNADKKGSHIVTTNSKLEEFIKNDELLKFYSNDIHELLDNYDLGDPNIKTDVVEQTKNIMEKLQKQGQSQTTDILLKNDNIVAEINGEESILSNTQIYNILQKFQHEKQDLLMKIHDLQMKLQN